MSFSIRSVDPLTFRLEKQGGALMTIRIAIFTKDTKNRVSLLFMGSAPNKVEVQTLPNLPPGNYQLVAVAVIEEGVNGTYEYDGQLNGNVFARRDGDVNESSGLDVETVVHRQNLTVV